MAKTVPIPADPQRLTSDDVEAAGQLRLRAARSSRPNLQRTKSNGANVGGSSQAGGARVRGGSF